MGWIEVKMGCASRRPAEFDDAVGSVLGQVGGQVDAQSMEFGQVLAVVGILPGAEL
jgi:hypothetical protein